MGNYMLGSYVQRAVSGAAFKDNAAAIINAGNADSLTKVISLITNCTPVKKYASFLTPNVGVGSSGNVGMIKAVAGSTFAGWYDGKFVMQKYGFVAGVSNNQLSSTASDTGGNRLAIASFTGYERLNITSWNAQTGAATYGAGRGVKVKASGIDGTVGRTADDAVRLSTITSRGELQIFTGRLNTPTQLDYPNTTNP